MADLNNVTIMFGYIIVKLSEVKYKQMAEKYGDQNYIDREKEIVHNWNNFPWTPEYIDLMNRMIAEQTKAGQMIPGAYPQVPSYIKTGSEITPYLIITATPKP